jgi:3-deoxy-D-manno-octulosonic-acid transferase
MDAYARAGADPHRATPARMHADLGPVPPGRRLKLYRATTRAARPLAPLLLRWRARRGKELTDRSGERYGIPSKPRPPGPLVWFHAASVGETMTILPLIDALALDRPNHHFLLTTGTVTAANLAADRLGPRMIHQFQPLDVPDYVGAFLDYWRPNLGVFTESEIWPNLILEADARGIALAIVNARMSKTSFRRWRKRPTVALPLFSRFSAVLAQNQTYARHFSDLGARTAVETGNLKIDVPPLPVNEAELARLRAAIGIRPRWLAASTHHDEESIAAGAHVEIAKSAPGLLTILAPRHPERGDAIADAVARAGLKLARRSRGELPAADTEIYLADTLGELGTFYALSPIVFMGKSLSGDGGGGHNPIEPIRLGAAVLTGPSWHNFEDAYRALIASGGTLEVRDGAALASAVVRLLADPDALAQQNAAGLRSINRLTGGLQRTREALERLLPDDGSSPPRDALSLPRREARRAP